jgi:hypothetical protein
MQSPSVSSTLRLAPLLYYNLMANAFYKIDSIRKLPYQNVSVFNLKVKQNEEYFANKILVHNCPSCPTYETEGWTPIADIVPVGMGCECSGKCKCTITYRKVLPAELPPTPIGSGTSETIATRTTRVGSRGTRVTSRISLSGGRLADQIMRKQEEL